jgi:hypothetical protein
MTVVAAGVAIGVGFARGAISPVDVIGCGAVGAALSAAVRALAGDSPAQLAGAVLAPLLVVSTLFDPVLAAHATWRAWLAISALGWTIVELARPTTSPLVALLPECAAAVCDPSFVALVPIASARVVTAPWRRPPWALAIPVAGTLVFLLGILACTAKSGTFAALGDRWCGAPSASREPLVLAMLAADRLGPMVAVAALGGLVVLVRPRHAEIAVLACLAGAALVSVRTGAIGPAVIALASVSVALAIGRFAAMIRFPAGQAVVAATAGLLLVLPPAWTAVEHGHRVPAGPASR